MKGGGCELIKNFLDFTVAMVLLLLLWPILLIIGICIKCETPGPIFFRQIRMGKGGKPFSVFNMEELPEIKFLKFSFNGNFILLGSTDN